MAQLHPAPAGAVLAEGDYAVLDIEGTLDNKPLDGTAKTGHLHKMGSNASRAGSRR